jgi:lipoprotein-anchoring transpeptidase ErfK/SrfK
LLQRKCACGGAPGPTGECESCHKKKLQRHRANLSAPSFINHLQSSVSEVPPTVHEILRSSGQPLGAETRAFMEPRFGHDFSHVRVHSGALAEQSAQDVDAKAYTVGHHIVFGGAQFAPGTDSGRQLLAHELTHVVQQNGESARGELRLAAKHDSYEREADRVAPLIISEPVEHRSRLETGTSFSQIQRQPAFNDANALTEEEESQGKANEDDVHDGDSPVNATPDMTGSLDDELSEAEDLSADAVAGPVELQQDPTPAKGGGQKSKPKPKPKAPPKKITSIDVDLAAQSLTLTWSDGTTEDHKITSGRGNPNTRDDPCKTQNEEHCTPAGDFTVGALGDANTANRGGDKMSWYVGFKEIAHRGIGIHDSQPLKNKPASHGCVRVGNSAADDAFAKKINKNVTSGVTKIHLFGKAPTEPWVKAKKKRKK